MTFRERVARRRKEQTRNLKKAAICAALVGIAAISIGMSRPAADTHQVEVTYTVQPGDTWWGIVEKGRVSAAGRAAHGESHRGNF